MKSRTLLNVVLLLLIAVLSLLAFYEPGKEAPTPQPLLTPLARAEAEHFRLERPGAPVVVLTRVGESWRLQEPVDAPANDYRVNGMLDLLGTPTFNRFRADRDDLARYGLADPRAILTVNGALTVAFGETTPLDQRRYVRVGDDIALIADTHYYKLLGDPGAFASPRLLPEGAELTRLDLPDLSVSRDAQGRWQVEPAPAVDSADRPAMLTDAWERARAIEVTLLEGAADGAPVTVQLAGAETAIVFLKGEVDGDPVLIRPDLQLVYHLAPATAGELFSLPEPPEAPPAPDPAG